MRCPHCKFENSGTAKFCSECGKSLEDSAVEQSLGDAKTRSGGGAGGDEAAQLSMQPTVPPKSQAAVASPDGEGVLIGGRYEIQRPLGQGGMGAVWLAKDTREGMGGRLVAVKRILDADDRGVQRFLRESETIANLNHQSIRAVFDRGEDEAGHFLVMEYVDGMTLQERVAREGALEGEAFSDLARGLGRALSYAHKRSVIHRDVKPANVLISEDGTPKLADFGLARMGHDSDLSMTGFGMGTLDYASPEQRRDAKSADHRSDIYGLGATLYFAAVGETPKTVRESRVPARWRTVILKCLEEKPEDRYFSADEFVEALLGSGSETDPSAAPVPQPTPTGTFACPSCEHPNPSEVKFCQSCGAGLFEPCPQCKAEWRTGVRHCGSCGVDMPAWSRSVEHLQAASRHLAAHAYGRAEKEAKLALEAVAGHEAPEAILKEARKKKAAAKRERSAAREGDGAGGYEDAEKHWRAVLELVPEDEEALQAIAALPERIRARDFLSTQVRLQKDVDGGNLDGAQELFLQLKTLAGDGDGQAVSKAAGHVRDLKARVRAARRRRLVRATGAALATVAAITVTWFGWAWNDNGRIQSEAEAQIRAGRFVEAGSALRKLHSVLVPRDDLRRDRVLDRVALHEEAMRRWPDADLPRPLRADLRDLTVPELSILSSLNDQLLEWAEAVVLGDPTVYLARLDILTPEQVVRRDAVVERSDLCETLRDRWPEDDIPEALMVRLRDLKVEESEILASYNDLLLGKAEGLMLDDPTVYLARLDILTPEQVVRRDAVVE
ncbi:MAG: protein kinase, partial [Planctomycetota bacterium]|nr:protein kinase [Planctomycetota bacterium]